MSACGECRVIIVDDHKVLRSSLRRALRADGFAIVGDAGTTDEALAVIATQRAEIALIDIEIPTRGGLWLAQQAQRLQPDLRPIAFTAHCEGSYVRAAFSAGVSGFVAKSESLTSVEAAIRRVASGGTYVSSALPRPTVVSPRRHLSDRETEVVRRVAMGHTNKEIAADLAVSAKTVETHRSRAMTKLGLLTRHDVYRYASETGLLEARFRLHEQERPCK